ncbi:FtsW/RodA/SpoVE family cell cycle protein [bacterium]|nr:FtsW/RodA/SpoVE family cell cycle protein [candidate division CSSED10-310 bacterium]
MSTVQRDSILERFRRRPIEGGLLFTAFISLLVGFGGIFVVRWSRSLPVRYEDWGMLPALFAGFFLTHLLFGAVKFRGDQLLLPGAFLLMGLGVVVQYRYGFIDYMAFTSWRYAGYPIGLAVFALLVLFLRQGGDRLVLALYGLALPAVLAIQAFLLVFGVTYRGARFAPGNMTPSELIKPLMVILFAGFLHRFADDLRRGPAWLPLPLPATGAVIRIAIIMTPPFLLVIFLKDMGLLAVLLLTFAMLLYLATRKCGYLVLLAGACVGGVAVLSRFMDYWSIRFIAWRDPFAVATTQGYQTVQSLMALFSGGWLGRGLGEGNPDRIPIVQTDFVYAGLGEELGFIGCAVILTVFAVLFHRGLRIGLTRKDHFQALLVTGAILCLAIQTIINLGGVVNLIPITGITLPFVSKGGSSLVATMILMGFIVGLSED